MRLFKSEGPWSIEPNELDFESAGLRCRLLRGPWGAWCGYVGVPSTHPWFKKSYSDEVNQPIPEDTTINDIGIMNAFIGALKGTEGEFHEIAYLVPCHGGVTYAGDGDFIEKDSKLWWFGFDCSHAGDLAPSAEFSATDSVYRDMAYVKASAERMASVIAAATGVTRDELIAKLRSEKPIETMSELRQRFEARKADHDS